MLITVKRRRKRRLAQSFKREKGAIYVKSYRYILKSGIADYDKHEKTACVWKLRRSNRKMKSSCQLSS